jgi:hypothetical protein
MKLFQQLLVAPAALGLIAPMAAQAADLNIDGVSDYSAAGEQVTSASQFSDVYPTDWAYKALSDLSKRYGCVAGYPSGTFNGNGSITRYEAAAMLNACLERVTEVSDDVERLVEEFGPELAVLKGKVDGFEARLGEMEAGQFSTTTKMSGVATFVVGGNSYGGDAHGAGDEKKRAAMAGDDVGGVSFNYDYKISLDTSFTGEDLLKSRLRAGNFGNDSAFSGSDYVALAGLEVAYESASGADSIEVDRLYYSFPYNEEFTIIVGPKVRQDDMLAVWPSVYPADSILDFFTYAGAPAAYNLALGGGAGVQYNNGDWDVSANYVSTNSEISKAADDNAAGVETDNGGGLMNEASGDNATAQIAYTQPNWGAAVAYSYTSGYQWNNHISGGKGTPLASLVDNMGVSNSYAISAYWTPDETGAIPSVSIGWGISNHDDEDDSDATYESATTQSWSIGFEWEDAFVDGNTAGFALGQATHVTELDQDGVAYPNNKADFDDDTNWAFEWWYKIQVSDNISVTPAMFYLRNPYGDQTDTRTGSNEDNDAQFNNLGALVKTTFQF